MIRMINYYSEMILSSHTISWSSKKTLTTLFHFLAMFTIEDYITYLLYTHQYKKFLENEKLQ